MAVLEALACDVPVLATPVVPIEAPAALRNDKPAPRQPSPWLGPMLAGLPSLFLDVCRDLLAIFWMFVDFKYAAAWPTRLLTLILLAAMLTSSIWNPLAYLWLVGPWLDKLVDLLLAFVMFKALAAAAKEKVAAARK